MKSSGDTTDYRKALSNFGTGVTVVSTHWQGQDLAMTCNSFSSVSLNPRLVLWSIRCESQSHEAFTRSEGYTVSVLARNQAALARQFANGSMPERFHQVPVVRTDSHRLRLRDATAWFDCDLEKIIEAGDHHILLGAVRSFGMLDAEGLGFYRSELSEFTALPS
ncbi:MAG: hypothetical protein RI902_629 [Pseudomonadota bacterium]|jgi:3-hydroxy-9,10-secoandrosta-1,3,5(10)-triene-9,17-dione monooxygenase reductase component